MNRVGWGRRTVVIIGLLAVAIMAAHLVDVAERQSTFRLVAADPPAAARRLVALYAPARADCPDHAASRDLVLLARALIAVERFSTSRIERWSEALLVRGFRVLGMWPLDLSIGPGQIRTSTVRKAAAWESGPQLRAAISVDTIARELLTTCGAERWAVRVLAWHAADEQLNRQELSQDALHRLAARFNGQQPSASGEAAVAHYLYRELVYHVFQELRFQEAAMLTQIRMARGRGSDPARCA